MGDHRRLLVVLPSRLRLGHRFGQPLVFAGDGSYVLLFGYLARFAGMVGGVLAADGGVVVGCGALGLLNLGRLFGARLIVVRRNGFGRVFRLGHRRRIFFLFHIETLRPGTVDRQYEPLPGYPLQASKTVYDTAPPSRVGFRQISNSSLSLFSSTSSVLAM